MFQRMFQQLIFHYSESDGNLRDFRQEERRGSARSRAGTHPQSRNGLWWMIHGTPAFAIGVFWMRGSVEIWMVNVDGKWLMDCWNMLEICGNMEYVWKLIWKILMKYPPTVHSPSIDNALLVDSTASKLLAYWWKPLCTFFWSGGPKPWVTKTALGWFPQTSPRIQNGVCFFLLQPSSLFRPSWNWEWRPSSEHGVSSAPHHWALAWTEASMRLMWEVIMRTEDSMCIYI